MISKLFQIISLLCFVTTSHSQINHNRNLEFDILKYDAQIHLNPSKPFIRAENKIEIKFLEDLKYLHLDLHAFNSKTGKGMKIDYIVDTKYNDTLNFEHKKDELFIRSIRFQKGYQSHLLIAYTGSPEDGLIFSQNKFGKPTVFADNWPDRAHYWLVCNDHPSDKALWNVSVIVPETFHVISNGVHTNTIELDSTHEKQIQFSTKVEIPTKVMVIGIADFAIDTLGTVENIPVSSWVFPENQKEGFYDYAQAKEVFEWFINKMDSYPFQKLANVQSKTRFGGMENAGCIFYFENSITGKREHEDLLAHEIAHQWFGNSASEIDWKHLWLSEGFATYLTDLYILEKHGEEVFHKRLEKERNKVIRFLKNSDHPIVDNTADLMSLLNVNSYQKGAWVLHMLRVKLGYEMFWKIIKEYYERYKLDNASTEDFISIVEMYSKINLKRFTNDWLYQPEIPNLKITTDIKGKGAEIVITQKQKHLIEFPIKIKAVGTKDSQIFEFKSLDQKTVLKIKTTFKIKGIIFDPKYELLYKKVEN